MTSFSFGTVSRLSTMDSLSVSSSAYKNSILFNKDSLVQLSINSVYLPKIIHPSQEKLFLVGGFAVHSEDCTQT